MKRSNSQSLAEVIQDLLHDYRLDEKVLETQLKLNWELWVGKTIAKYTRDIRLKQGKLYLKIDSAPLKNELHYAAPMLLKNLNEFLKSQVITELIVN